MLFNVIRILISLQRSQWFDKKKLSQIQTNRLTSIISHAYNNVAFYKELYTSVGVNDNLTIENLPCITKEMIRRVPVEKLVAGGVITKKHRVSHTSGSSGMPLKIVRLNRDDAFSDALRLRSFLAQGAKLSDKVCTIRPVPAGEALHNYQVTEKKRFYAFLRARRAKPLPLSSNLERHIELIKKWQPQILSSFPSYLIQLIDICKKNDESLTFKMIRTQGELVSQQARKTIEEFFHTQVFDSYGAAEVGHVAWECPTHEGYHVNAETTFVEVLRNGSPALPGEEGEICVTSLCRYTMPFIRYLLGDVVTILDDECSCGRGLPLIGKIHGRVLDVVVRKDGLPVFPLTILHTFHDIGGLDMFRVVQRSDYVVEVFIKPYRGFEESVREEVENRCLQLFPSTPFVVKTVDGFEKDNVKFRPVVSHVNTALKNHS